MTMSFLSSIRLMPEHLYLKNKLFHCKLLSFYYSFITVLKSWHSIENCFQTTCVGSNAIYGFHLGRRKEHYDALHQGVQSQMPLEVRQACVRWPGNDTVGCGRPTPPQSIQSYKAFKDFWTNQMWLLSSPTVRTPRWDLHSRKR